MKSLFIFLLLLLTVGGCRFSISAEKLQLAIAIDQAAYLSDEDSTTYTNEPAINPDTTN